MQRIGIGMLVLALLGGAADARAEAVGSPASILKKGKWIMGLGGGAAPGRDLDGGRSATVYQLGHFRGYGLTDWLSLYGKIGVARVEVDDPTIIKTHSTETTNSFGENLYTSVQIKTRLFEQPRWRLEWDGSLQYVDIRNRHRGKNEGRWHEWQFATSLAKAVGRLNTYAGVKYDLTRFVYRVREDGMLLRQDAYHQNTPVGFFVGTDVMLGRSEDVVLNIESSYLDGPEVDVGIAYTF